MRAAVAVALLVASLGCGGEHRGGAREIEALPKSCIDKMLLTDKTVCGPTQLPDYYVCDRIALKAECVEAVSPKAFPQKAKEKKQP